MYTILGDCRIDLAAPATFDKANTTKKQKSQTRAGGETGTGPGRS